jgi:hypothetical protein
MSKLQGHRYVTAFAGLSRPNFGFWIDATWLAEEKAPELGNRFSAP